MVWMKGILSGEVAAWGGVVSAIPSVHPFFNNVGYCLNFDILVYWQKTTSLQ